MYTGVSLAFAIAETLIDSSAFTLFVTHYPQCTVLADMYATAKNVHLKTVIDLNTSAQRAAAAGGIKFLHSLGAGPYHQLAQYCG